MKLIPLCRELRKKNMELTAKLANYMWIHHRGATPDHISRLVSAKVLTKDHYTAFMYVWRNCYDRSDTDFGKEYQL